MKEPNERALQLINDFSTKKDAIKALDLVITAMEGEQYDWVKTKEELKAL